MTATSHDPDLPAALLTRMIAAAREAVRHSYSPYSAFRVGAAVLTATGEIFAGCNIENASYGLTMCAERVAIFQAAAQGHRQLTALVVYTPTTTATAPCGACRQVLFEFGPGAWVVGVCDTSHRLETTLAMLLPEAFGPHDFDKQPEKGV